MEVSQSLLIAGALLVAWSSALAQADRQMRIRFWNLTAQTVTSMFLAPAGSESYGPDQCRNEQGRVAPDERLRITGIGPGRYDVKLQDQTGRECVGEISRSRQAPSSRLPNVI